MKTKDRVEYLHEMKTLNTPQVRALLKGVQEGILLYQILYLICLRLTLLPKE